MTLGKKMPSLKMKTIEKIATNINEINVSCAEIKEHLKNLNGTVARHEKNLGELYNENKKQDKVIYKMLGSGVVSGGIVGVVVWLVSIMPK